MYGAILDIIGKRVMAIKGSPVKDKRIKQPIIFPFYILFDDGKTWIQLEDQDSYDYHDFSDSAKEIRVYSDEKLWKDIFTYPDANVNRL